MTAAVEVRDAVIRYGALVAVSELSFRAEPGQVTALLGPNGAGKTSIVEACEGFRRLDAGTVRVLGLDPVADHAALTERLGAMLQQGGVYPGIRVGEAVRLFCSYYDSARDPDSLVELVGLT
ncbi:MAG: ATP-binding cassette domain-containing protein, partial [Dehalococcoidia bacterium]|nr:ATP-binding cassette domain-containing protein [Dehalococcoidia bacterium]